MASRAGKLAIALLLPGAHAFTFAPIPAPNLDLNDLGRVAFAGDFDSISLYQFEGQREQSGSNGAFLSRFPNGAFATIQDTDADIKAMCAFTRKGAYQGVVFGGNFTSVGGQHTPGGIALLNTTDGSVKPLGGLNGSVNAIYCDNDGDGRVYVGGSFSGGNSTNAIVWQDSWTNMPFSGFNGPVHSIVKASSGNIIFGGEFNGLGNNALTAPRKNNTQVLPVGSANLTAPASSGRPGLSDPKNIVCKSDASTQGSDKTWLLEDNTPGFWQADFGFGFQPTKLRLHNTNLENRGTKQWRFTALPDGGIMNFSYVDPSGQKRFCDANCSLPVGNTSAQDFEFVNQVGMNSFKIDISQWYGQGGGLNGIEITQNDIYTFAINNFNEPKCGGTTTGASSSATSPWMITPSHQSNSQYLTATLPGNPVDVKQTVVFEPDITQPGDYSVLVYTPGCIGDDTCNTRGIVEITGNMSRKASSNPTINTLYQTNEYDKYDEIYVGYMDATDGFKPSVTLAPAPGQVGPKTFVAQRVRFQLRNATAGGLNGLFEYDPSKQEIDTNFASSVIDAAGAQLNLQRESIITSLATQGDRLFVGGNFSAKSLNNIFAVDKGAREATPLTGAGLNGQVLSIYVNGDTAYFGGNFTNTQNRTATGLNGVAAYVNDEWQPLGAGISGSATYIVPFTLNLTANAPETVLGISGFFNQVNVFDKNSAFAAPNFAVWVPSRGNWLHNLNINTVSLQGSLTAFSEVPNSQPVFAGSMSSGSLGVSGAVALESGNPLSLEPFAAPVRAQQQQSSLRKRAMMNSQNISTTGIVTAAFYKENNMNKTILAGHFAATGTNGQNITNLLIIDGKDSDHVTGIETGVDKNSTFAALAVSNNVLFAGGSVSGTINNNKAGGIVAYDLQSNQLASIQPPALRGTNVTVSSIAPRPKSQDIFVGGQFQSAGALSCPALCIWNTERNQWTSPSDSISGVVSSLTWVSDTKLLIAGNLTSGNNQTKIISFDTTTNQFSEFVGSRDLPGPVTALTLASSDGTQIWVSGQASDGTAFLQRFDGSKWRPVNDMFQPGTTIRSIQVLSLSSSHGPSDMIDQQQELLILGQINVTNFGSASGVLYNGTSLTPFLLSTSSDNKPGSLSQVFVENPRFFLNKNEKHLALGFIVLIALAIALGLTFLLVVAGILIEWYRKRAQGYTPAPTAYPDRTINTSRVPPEHLFGTLRGNQAPAL